MDEKDDLKRLREIVIDISDTCKDEGYEDLYKEGMELVEEIDKLIDE